jgi:hypothetical protein
VIAEVRRGAPTGRRVDSSPVGPFRLSDGHGEQLELDEDACHDGECRDGERDAHED